MPMKDPAKKQQWIDALLSGNFKQGYGKLTRFKVNEAGEYEQLDCCLSVACRIFGAEYGEETGDDYDNVVFRPQPNGELASYKNSTNESMMPLALAEELGITAMEQNTLANLNDGRWAADWCPPEDRERQRSFAEIAEIIREKL